MFRHVQPRTFNTPTSVQAKRRNTHDTCLIIKLGLPVKPRFYLLYFLFSSVVYRETHFHGFEKVFFVPFEVLVLRNVLKLQDASKNGQYSNNWWDRIGQYLLSNIIFCRKDHLELFLQMMVMMINGIGNA